MPWQAMSFDELPAVQREEYLSQEPMLDLQIQLYASPPGRVDVRVNVPDGSKLKQEAATGGDLGQILARLEQDVGSAVKNSLQLLVAEPGQLAPATGRVAGNANAAIDLRLLFLDYGLGNVEGSLSMPDPTSFRRDLADGKDLADVMGAAGSLMAGEAAAALRVEILQRRALGR